MVFARLALKAASKGSAIEEVGVRGVNWRGKGPDIRCLSLDAGVGEDGEEGRLDSRPSAGGVEGVSGKGVGGVKGPGVGRPDRGGVDGADVGEGLSRGVGGVEKDPEADTLDVGEERIEEAQEDEVEERRGQPRRLVVMNAR